MSGHNRYSDKQIEDSVVSQMETYVFITDRDEASCSFWMTAEVDLIFETPFQMETQYKVSPTPIPINSTRNFKAHITQALVVDAAIGANNLNGTSQDG